MVAFLVVVLQTKPWNLERAIFEVQALPGAIPEGVTVRAVTHDLQPIWSGVRSRLLSRSNWGVGGGLLQGTTLGRKSTNLAGPSW